MLGVFIAYFVTIVVFAGLYLTVNKVGERYNNHGDIDNGGDGSDGGGGGGPNGGGEEGGMEYENNVMADVSSFCGMDINNHMEGELVCFLIWFRMHLEGMQYNIVACFYLFCIVHNAFLTHSPC